MQEITIFLSHSVHKESDKQIMDQLIQLLKEAGYDVYCDRERLKVGDRWRNELYSAICSCHAAVVLVTQEALDTKKYPWAFKECSMFTMIKYINSQFPIFPITMTGVTLKDIEKSPFKALQLNEIMAGSHEDLESVIEKIKSTLNEQMSSDEPHFYHQKRIADILPSSNSELMKRTIEKLDPRENTLNCKFDTIRYILARILLSLSADDFIAALPNVLSDIIRKLGTNESKQLVYLLAPFWLDHIDIASMEHANQIDQIVVQSNENDPSNNEDYFGKSIFLNAQKQQMALFYINYAGFLKEEPYFCPILLTNNSPFDDITNYESQILAGISKLLPFEVTLPLDKTVLNFASDSPVFIIFPYGTDIKVIRALREKFKPFIFIVLYGKDDDAILNLPDLMKFKPLLEEETEDRIFYYYSLAWGKVIRLTPTAPKFC